MRSLRSTSSYRPRSFSDFLRRKRGEPVKRKLNEADALAAQFSVWGWVDLQNRSAGVALSVAVVIEQRNLRFQETKSGIWGELTAASSTQKSASYKWVARWKRDWNLAFGKASEHEVLPTETVRTKALAERTLAQAGERFLALSNAFSPTGLVATTLP